MIKTVQGSIYMGLDTIFNQYSTDLCFSQTKLLIVYRVYHSSPARQAFLGASEVGIREGSYSNIIDAPTKLVIENLQELRAITPQETSSS